MTGQDEIMAKLIDLTPILEENTQVNHSHHPRGPLVLPNQRYDFVRWFYAETWRRGGGPPLYDGLPEEWGSPEAAREWRHEEVLVHTHLSAHIDAAQHFNPFSSQDAAEIPLDPCCGRAVLLDLRQQFEEPFPITPEALDRPEAASGEEVGAGDIVILHTGWLTRWGLGPEASRDRDGAIPNPGLHPGAPPWFIERRVKLVGGDVQTSTTT